VSLGAVLLLHFLGELFLLGEDQVHSHVFVDLVVMFGAHNSVVNDVILMLNHRNLCCGLDSFGSNDHLGDDGGYVHIFYREGGSVLELGGLGDLGVAFGGVGKIRGGLVLGEFGLQLLGKVRLVLLVGD